MANLNALRAELDSDPLGYGYSTMTDAQAAAKLNEQSIIEYVSVPASELKRFFFVEDIWPVIKSATDLASSTTRDALTMFDSIRMADPDIRAKVTQLVDGLVAQSYMTTDQKTRLLAMGETYISRAQELNLLGLSPSIGAAHIAQARA